MGNDEHSKQRYVEMRVYIMKYLKRKGGIKVKRRVWKENTEHSL